MKFSERQIFVVLQLTRGRSEVMAAFGVEAVAQKFVEKMKEDHFFENSSFAIQPTTLFS